MDTENTDSVASPQVDVVADVAEESRSTREVVAEQLELAFEAEQQEALDREDILNPSQENDDEQEMLQQHENGSGEPSESQPLESGSEPEQGSVDGRSESLDVEQENGEPQQLAVTETPEYVELQAKYQELQPAEEFLSYIQEQNLTEDDVHRALELATLYNTDPERALKYFQPLVNDLQAQQGSYLYPEIQQLVDDGEMTEAAAAKYQQSLIQQAKMQENVEYEEQTRQQAEQLAQQQQQQQQQQFFDSMQSNANSWEAGIRAQDPDYDVPLFQGGNTKGQEVLMTVTHMINSNGYPNSVAQQNDMLRQAYESVNLKISRLRGGQAIKPPPQTAASNRDIPQKQKLVMGEASTRDIVKQLMFAKQE